MSAVIFSKIFAFVFLLFWPLASNLLSAKERVAIEGKGFLEKEENQLILHLKGTAREMGYQHGKLLANQIRENIALFIDGKDNKVQQVVKKRFDEFYNKLPRILPHIPQEFIEEMEGIAQGANLPYEKILLLNLFPEMFHCMGFALFGQATLNQELYHVRVLDYAIGKQLQNSAVVMVVEPEKAIPFLNVSYAGFIGSVTGMNSNKISIGEIGGQGYGYWDGVPMAFLLRQLLQQASSLDDAIHLLEASPRTCEYYYLIADGKANKAMGIYATASQLHLIMPGSSYGLLAPGPLPKNYEMEGKNDKFFLSSYFLDYSDYQTTIYRDNSQKELIALFHRQLPDTIALTGFSNSKRYPILIERLLARYGKFTLEELKEIIKAPLTSTTNLHNALFFPAKLQLLVSHAGSQGEPASSQPYHFYSLETLLTEN